MRNSISILLTVLSTILILAGCGTAPEPPQAAVQIQRQVEAAAEQVKEATDQAQTAAMPASALMSEAAVKKPYNIATVADASDSSWSSRLEEGVKQFDEENKKVNAFQIESEQPGGVPQVKIIEALINQQVDAIAVVPTSPEVLEPVLWKAREQGIVVISHGAPQQQNIDYDLEAFDNAAYGRHLMEALAERMGEAGEYAVFVGNGEAHKAWIEAALAYQQETYPKMTLVEEKIETDNDPQNAYEATKDLLITHPNIKAFLGSAFTDVVGIGEAIEEEGLEELTVVVGASLPSMTGNFLKSGAVEMISYWDPKLAGQAMNEVAVKVLKGQELQEGANLGIPGYENLTTPDGKIFYGQAWIDVTDENVDEHPF